MGIGWIITAFVLGLGGSLHCLGMCGPLILMMPFKSGENSSTALNLTVYFVSKSVLYGVIGLVIGLFGLGIRGIMGQYLLSLVAGSFILGVTLWPVLNRWLALPSKLHLKMVDWYNRLNTRPRWYYFIVLGVFNALLPCVMIWVAAGASAVTADPVKGFLFMSIFGLGTAPALIAAFLSQSIIKRKLRLGLQRTSKIIAFVLGIVLLMRGLNLNIPHSHSPVMNQVSKLITCKVPQE